MQFNGDGDDYSKFVKFILFLAGIGLYFTIYFLVKLIVFLLFNVKIEVF